MGIPNHRLMQKTTALREKEKLARNALFIIAKHEPLSESLVLQGGNCLHFIYSSPRHSQDLDFVLANKSTSITKIIDMIGSVLSAKYNVETSRNYLNKIRLIERVKYWKDDSNIRGIIEVADQISLQPTTTEGEFHPLLVELPSEIYADKIIATLERMDTRGSIKATDLFDLLYIKETLKITPGEDELRAKAESYKSKGWNKETLNKTLNYILSGKNFDKMEEDIRKSMLPDISKLYKFGREFFENAAQCFIQLYSLMQEAPKSLV